MSSRSEFIKGIIGGLIIASLIIAGTNIYLNQSQGRNAYQAIMNIPNIPNNTTGRSTASQFSLNPLVFAPVLIALLAGLLVFLLIRHINKDNYALD